MPSPRFRIAELLRNGTSPSRIAGEMNMSLGSVMNQLYRLVGEGSLRRSDILFTLDPAARKQIETIVQERGTVQFGKIRRYLKDAGYDINDDDLRLYLKLRDARVDLGDTYELIRDLELNLHKFIRQGLTKEYGNENWWREGVPLHVREDCALVNERDPEPASDLFCYTTVMHLFMVLDKKWSTLSEFLPPSLRSDKQAFLADLKRLNGIRNKVMHPVKGYVITEEDYDFLRHLHSNFMPAVSAVMEAPSKAEPREPEPQAA
ncbi:MAG: Swt1 family HEPN domain-containing protein [Terriglobales bacterium]